MTRIVKAHQCNFCTRIFRYPGKAITHELRCVNNPAIHACKTCIYSQHGSPYPEDNEPSHFCDHPEYVLPEQQNDFIGWEFPTRECEHWEAK